MLRYRCWPCLGVLLLVGACAVPSARENADATAALVAPKVPAALTWRRDAEEDRAARELAEQMLEGGLTVREAVAVSFLASPDLQLAFEQLEISRAELVAATRPTNPYVIVGSREPGGDLAAFYPERTISVGVLQNVMSLLTIPDRRATATHNLERVRYEVAQRAAEHAAQVAEAWYRYRAALAQLELHELSANAVRSAVDTLTVLAANDDADEEDVEEGRLSLAVAESNVDRARLEAADERARLETLLGIAGWRDDWSLDGELPELPAADPDAATIERAALHARFDLLAAQKNIDMRLRELAMQRRFRWLTEFEIGVFRDKAIGDTPFTGPTIATEVPIFDQRQAALLQADAQLRSAVRSLEAAVLEMRQQVRRHAQAVTAMRRLAERYERDVLPLHQRASARLGAGDPSELPRLNARLSMLEAQRAHLEVLRDYWVARSAMAQAAGDWIALSGLQ
jgi:cobalt-zinc-cadmium efflux system outer membrane protein